MLKAALQGRLHLVMSEATRSASHAYSPIDMLLSQALPSSPPCNPLSFFLLPHLFHFLPHHSLFPSVTVHHFLPLLPTLRLRSSLLSIQPPHLQPPHLQPPPFPFPLSSFPLHLSFDPASLPAPASPTSPTSLAPPSFPIFPAWATHTSFDGRSCTAWAATQGRVSDSELEQRASRMAATTLGCALGRGRGQLTACVRWTTLRLGGRNSRHHNATVHLDSSPRRQAGPALRARQIRPAAAGPPDGGRGI